MIEGQAVAVNFFSLPDVPGRSYVLDVDQITLAIERQNDERPAICATDALPALDHLNGDLWTLPPAPLSRNSRSGAIRGSGRTRTSAVPWLHLRPGKDHGTTAGPRCSPPEPAAGRSGRQPGLPHPASAPTGASESVGRFRFGNLRWAVVQQLRQRGLRKPPCLTEPDDLRCEESERAGRCIDHQGFTPYNSGGSRTPTAVICTAITDIRTVLAVHVWLLLNVSPGLGS